MNQLSPDLLTEYHDQVQFEYAGTGQRFANFIIDIIVFYLFVIVCTIFILAANPAQYNSLVAEDSVTGKLQQYLISYTCFLVVYTLQEALFKGKTLGKLITKTKAVKLDGSPIGWKEALMRSLSRIVPFEPFSGFGGHPWHDRWTDTMVVKQ